MAGESGWQADPSGRHQERWFDGAGWTEQVRDHGVVNTDRGGVPGAAPAGSGATPGRPAPAGPPPSATLPTSTVPPVPARRRGSGPSPFGKIDPGPGGAPLPSPSPMATAPAPPASFAPAGTPPPSPGATLGSVPVYERIPSGTGSARPTTGSRPGGHPPVSAVPEGQSGLAVLGNSSVVSGLLAGALGGALGMGLAELVKNPDRIVALTESELQVQSGIWVAIIGAVLGAVLASWASITSSAWGQAGRTAALGAAVGAVAGFVGGYLAQLIYIKMLQDLTFESSQSTIEGRALLARGVGWGIFGAILGLGLGLPSGARRAVNGLVGGLVGGAVGGLVFQQLANAEVTTSAPTLRFAGIVATGTGIGLGIGVVDRITRQVWIQFLSGPLRGREVTVYKPRTTLGGASSCDLVLANDPTVLPVHLTVSVGTGAVTIEPAGPVTVSGEPIAAPRSVRSGDLIEVGRSQFTIVERAAR